MCSAGYQLDAECNLPCFHCNPQITSSVKDWKSEEHQASSFFKFAPNGIVITSPASSSYYILHFLCCDKRTQWDEKNVSSSFIFSNVFINSSTSKKAMTIFFSWKKNESSAQLPLICDQQFFLLWSMKINDIFCHCVQM